MSAQSAFTRIFASAAALVMSSVAVGSAVGPTVHTSCHQARTVAAIEAPGSLNG